MIRVLLADDEELTRAGLRMMLRTQPDLTVVGWSGGPVPDPGAAHPLRGRGSA
ncbi:hypothetical protein ACIQAC_19010 [Streptomyces sp. NPDC088387]|uniref:hypothetical protein n=1 Tax=Streptomyces sp. NPDC088387 TaxID=3365859 RepID=UPI00380561AA